MKILRLQKGWALDASPRAADRGLKTHLQVGPVSASKECLGHAKQTRAELEAQGPCVGWCVRSLRLGSCLSVAGEEITGNVRLASKAPVPLTSFRQDV